MNLDSEARAALKGQLSGLADHFDHFLSSEIASDLRRLAAPEVGEAMLYSLLAGGKRIRPILAILCSSFEIEIDGVNDSPAAKYKCDGLLGELYYAAAALESIHTYSLIHDDLPSMDNDSLRRGRPTCHVAYSEWQAILAGDALNTYAFDLLSRHNESGRMAEKVATLARAAGVSGMVCGQALDLAAERGVVAATTGADQAATRLEAIHRRKTAALIAASCRLGALIGGCELEDVERFGEYGEKLGLLFQIADDILDETADAAALGKSAGKDREQGKLTYVTLFGLSESRRLAAELVDELQALAASLPQRSSEQLTVRFCDRRPTLAALADYIAARSH